MKKILTCLLASLGLTSACGQQDFENRDVRGFSELLEDQNVVVLDVRTAEEFNEGHLANAVNIDVRQEGFVEKAKAALPADKTIAVYCRSGKRSALAAGQLVAEGLGTVAILAIVLFPFSIPKWLGGKTMRWVILAIAVIFGVLWYNLRPEREGEGLFGGKEEEPCRTRRI